uniref:Uncharacterized protein n=1 Tax=Aegilops tauschii subsp. strangulata TaxID=200361 RepID=A0A453R1J6_AEGTS
LFQLLDCTKEEGQKYRQPKLLEKTAAHMEDRAIELISQTSFHL